MFIQVQDSQIVGETDGQLLSLIQQTAVSTLGTQFILHNTGANTANYRFQEFNGATWVDLATLDQVDKPDLNSTLSANQVKTITVKSSYPQIRLMGSASGDASVDFLASRYVSRLTGGQLPILSF